MMSLIFEFALCILFSARLTGAGRAANDVGEGPSHRDTESFMQRVEMRRMSMLHQRQEHDAKATKSWDSWAGGLFSGSSSKTDAKTDIVVKPFKIDSLSAEDPWRAELSALPKPPVEAQQKTAAKATHPFKQLVEKVASLDKNMNDPNFNIERVNAAAGTAQLKAFEAHKALSTYAGELRLMKEGGGNVISNTYKENSEVAGNLKNAYDEAVEWDPDDFKIGALPEVQRKAVVRDTSLDMPKAPAVQAHPGKWAGDPDTYCSKSGEGTVPVLVDDFGVDEGFTLTANACEQKCMTLPKCNFYTHGTWMAGTSPTNLIMPGHYGETRCQMYEKCEKGELAGMTLFPKPGAPGAVATLPGTKWHNAGIVAALAGSAARSASRSATDLANSASQSASDLADSASQSATDLANSAHQSASDLADSASQSVSHAGTLATYHANSALNSATDLANSAADSASDYANKAATHATSMLLPQGVSFPSNSGAEKSSKELYAELLAVEPDQRKKWYKKAMLEWHPDKHPAANAEEKEKVEDTFKFLQSLKCPGKMIPGYDCEAATPDA